MFISKIQCGKQDIKMSHKFFGPAEYKNNHLLLIDYTILHLVILLTNLEKKMNLTWKLGKESRKKEIRTFYHSVLFNVNNFSVKTVHITYRIL